MSDSTDGPRVSTLRYPLEPLEKIMLARLRADAADPSTIGLAAIATALGAGLETIRRAQQHGLRLEPAERFAHKIGLHPYELWPQMVADILELGDPTERERDRKRQQRERKRRSYAANREQILARRRDRKLGEVS